MSTERFLITQSVSIRLLDNPKDSRIPDLRFSKLHDRYPVERSVIFIRRNVRVAPRCAESSTVMLFGGAAVICLLH
jgi:hypothetical protein